MTRCLGQEQIKTNTFISFVNLRKYITPSTATSMFLLWLIPCYSSLYSPHPLIKEKIVQCVTSLKSVGSSRVKPKVWNLSLSSAEQVQVRSGSDSPNFVADPSFSDVFLDDSALSTVISECVNPIYAILGPFGSLSSRDLR